MKLTQFASPVSTKKSATPWRQADGPAPWNKDKFVKHGKWSPAIVAPPGKTLKWECDKCQRILEASDSAKLSILRHAHIKAAHPGWSGKDFHQFLQFQPAVVESVPEPLRCWTCSKCKKGIRSNSASRHQTTKAAKAHLRMCVGPNFTMWKNRRALDRQRLEHPGISHFGRPDVETRAALLQARAQTQDSKHDIVRISIPCTPPKAREQRRMVWGCRHCFSVWSRSNKLLHSSCGGISTRLNYIAKKDQFWVTLRKHYPAQIPRLVKMLRVNRPEARKLEDCAKQINKGRWGVTPLTHTRWYRDLTEEGIHPHPGPSVLHGFFVNTGGLTGTYKAIQHAVECDPLPDILGFAECRANEREQKALIAHLQHKGYRAWTQVLSPNAAKTMWNVPKAACVSPFVKMSVGFSCVLP